MSYLDFIKEHHEWQKENIINRYKSIPFEYIQEEFIVTEKNKELFELEVKKKKIELKLQYINELKNCIESFKNKIKKYRYNNILEAEIVAHNVYEMIIKYELELKENKDNYCDWTIKEIKKDIDKLKVGYYSNQIEKYENTLKYETINLKEAM